MGAHTSEAERRKPPSSFSRPRGDSFCRGRPKCSAASRAAYSCESVSSVAAINMCSGGWAEQDRRMETIPRHGRCKRTSAVERRFGAPRAGEGRGGKGTAACKGEGGELREARMPSRGMRVRRKRGEQLLSCQREPLNLPADLLTIVPASYHHALSPFSCVPSPCVRLLSPSLAASFCSSAPNTTISLSREEDFVERRSAIDGM